MRPTQRIAARSSRPDHKETRRFQRVLESPLVAYMKSLQPAQFTGCWPELRTLDLGAIFELSDEYAIYARTRSACERAVDRLPNRQRQVVQGYYFEAMTQPELAARDGLADSTIRSLSPWAAPVLANRFDRNLECLDDSAAKHHVGGHGLECDHRLPRGRKRDRWIALSSERGAQPTEEVRIVGKAREDSHYGQRLAKPPPNTRRGRCI